MGATNFLSQHRFSAWRLLLIRGRPFPFCQDRASFPIIPSVVPNRPTAEFPPATCARTREEFGKAIASQIRPNQLDMLREQRYAPISVALAAVVQARFLVGPSSSRKVRVIRIIGKRFATSEEASRPQREHPTSVWRTNRDLAVRPAG
jgi:hypothetical protein